MQFAYLIIFNQSPYFTSTIFMLLTIALFYIHLFFFKPTTFFIPTNIVVFWKLCCHVVSFFFFTIPQHWICIFMTFLSIFNFKAMQRRRQCERQLNACWQNTHQHEVFFGQNVNNKKTRREWSRIEKVYLHTLLWDWMKIREKYIATNNIKKCWDGTFDERSF